jgi:CheY-like chemotaxis protein
VIKNFIYKFKKLETVEDALRLLLPSKIIEQAELKANQFSLLEDVAEITGARPDELLGLVAEKLNFTAVINLSIPDQALVKKLGYEENFLRDNFTIPQRTSIAKAGYALVTAEPSLIDIKNFEQLGVPVYLGLASSVEEAWQKFARLSEIKEPTLSSSQLFSLLTRLALDADELGAKEVRISEGLQNRYYFSANNKEFSGQLHTLVHSKLLELLQDKRISEQEIICSEIKKLTISSDFSRLGQHFTLSWHKASDQFSAPASLEAEKVVQKSPIVFELIEKTKSISKRARNILIIDDDTRFVTILSRILEDKGWKVRREPDGEKALNFIDDREAFTEFNPALVISDIHMPNCDGPEFLKRFRKKQTGLPVLMLTSDDNKLLEAELALLGANAFVRKQDDPRILLAWCNNLTSENMEDELPEITEVPKVAVGNIFLEPEETRH